MVIVRTLAGPLRECTPEIRNETFYRCWASQKLVAKITFHVKNSTVYETYLREVEKSFASN